MRDLYLVLRVILISVFVCAIGGTEAATAADVRLYGVNLGPFTKGQDPNRGATIGASELRRHIAFVAPYTQWIRVFGCGGGLEAAGAIGHEYGLKVAMTAWIGRDAAVNTAQIDCVVSQATKGNIDLALIGSEALYRHDVTDAQLAAYIRGARALIPPAVPVGVADSYAEILGATQSMAAADVLAMNAYPYWEGTHVRNAAGQVRSAWQQVRTAAPTKRVIISETGWPSAGMTRGAAEATPEAASTFLQTFLSWARPENIEYFVFEAFDEPFKAQYEQGQGAHFGIWDRFFRLKPGMAAVLAGGQVPYSGCSGPIGGSGTPVIEATYVPAYGRSGELYGRVRHVNPCDYIIGAYLNVNSVWWVKPYADARRVIPISDDGTFHFQTVTGGVDQYAGRYMLYLLPKNYSPPAVTNVPTLPLELEQNAVARLMITRTQHSITGRITDQNSRPVSGVTVRLTGAATLTAETTDNGEYSFYALESGASYTVTPTGALTFNPATAIVTSLSGNVVKDFSTTVPVTQTACQVTLPVDRVQLTENRQTGQFSVRTTPAGCSWQVASDSAWLQPYPLTGVGDGTVRFTAFPNHAPRQRDGQLGIGNAVATVSQAPGTGTDTERFIKLAYFYAFGREPSPNEVAFQVASVERIGRAAFVDALMSTPEFDNISRFVAGAYIGLLDRLPEFGGWLFQRDAMVSGAISPVQLAENIVNSEEFRLKYGNTDDTAFVRVLYRQILEREPSEAEVDFQVQALHTSARGALAYGFLRSAEFLRGRQPRVNVLLTYAVLLSRDASPSEMSAGVDALRAGSTRSELITGVLGRTEFVDQIR